MADSSPGVRLDVGGTFTDAVAAGNGALSVTKTPSTPDARDEGVLEGLERSQSETHRTFAAVATLAHGTTAVFERDRADVALVTTEGFRDALEIARQDRPDSDDYTVTKPEPIVPTAGGTGAPRRTRAGPGGGDGDPADHDREAIERDLRRRKIPRPRPPASATIDPADAAERGDADRR